MKKLSILLLLALILPASLLAQDDDWRNRRGRDRDRRDDYRTRRGTDGAFELNGFIGYRYGGTLFADQTGFAQDVRAESGKDYGANFGIPLGDNGFKLELMANRQNTHLTARSGLFSPTDRVADFHVTYYQAGLVIPFARSRMATPYLIVGAGVANLDPDIPDTAAENRFSASAGVGVKIPFSYNFGIRAEARGYYTALPSDAGCRRCYYNYNYRDFSQGETNVGLYFRF